MKHEGLVTGAAALGVSLDPGQAEVLHRYEAFLRDRAVPLGMIGRGDAARLRDRHVLDSLRAVPAMPINAVFVLDLGSGAGLPGIPIAIARPDLQVTLAETRHQRIAFLELVGRDLGLTNVSVHGGRAEDAPGVVEVCLARAFRDAAGSWRVAEPLLSPDGCLLYFAGTRFDSGRDLPPEVDARVVPTSPLANAGPLVIMTRK